MSRTIYRYHTFDPRNAGELDLPPGWNPVVATPIPIAYEPLHDREGQQVVAVGVFISHFEPDYETDDAKLREALKEMLENYPCDCEYEKQESRRYKGMVNKRRSVVCKFHLLLGDKPDAPFDPENE